MSFDTETIENVINEMDIRYGSDVSQAMIDKNGGDIQQMSSLELEQTMDDFLTMLNDH